MPSAPASPLSRRTLLSSLALGAAGAAAAVAAPSKSPNERLVIAAVGVGGVGASYLKDLESEDIAFLCDVDHDYAAKTFAKYPKAKQYRDFRKMLGAEKSIDAVVVATPDHSHAVVAKAALDLGKHVYCAKPMTRTIAETRALVKLAKEKRVATQMSVQTCRSEDSCLTIDWIRAGAAGKVREVHVWSDRPVWPQGLERPASTGNMPPASLDWDLWLGPAPFRPYHKAYHPFAWRGWYDFGTGALGDMGCHAMHVVVTALGLGAPLRVSASVAEVRIPLGPGDKPHWSGSRRANLSDSFPHASIVTWEFAGGARVIWYDGGLKPARPAEMGPGAPALAGSGLLFVGDRGVLSTGFTGGEHRLYPESRATEFAPPPATIERSKGHYQEWVAACKGGKPAFCEFGFGGALTELVLLGNLAVRGPAGKTLEWDAAAGRTSDAAANAWISEPYRTGW